MNTSLLMPTSAVLRVTTLLMTLPLLTDPAFAQMSTETKIHLLAEALRARDAGELELAKKNAEQLLALAPNDASVQRLLKQVEELIAAGDPSPRAVPGEALVDVRIPEPEKPAEDASAPSPIIASNPASPVPEPDPSMAEIEAAAEAATKAEARRIDALLKQVPAQRRQARRLAGAGRYDEAIGVLRDALAALPLNPLTEYAVANLGKDRDKYFADHAAALKRAAAERDEAERLAWAKTAGPRETATTRRAAAKETPAETVRVGPPALAAPTAEPVFETFRREIAALAAKGRAQYLAGELDGAQETFRAVETRDPDNADAKRFLLRIATERNETGELNREKTRAQLLEEVTKSWQRPGRYQERGRQDESSTAVAPLARKLDEITLPAVNFTHVEIGKVVIALGAMSEEFDSSTAAMKGVNIVLLDPANKAPAVTLTLRNTSLRRVLDFITESIGYQYDVQPDAVVLRPGGDTSTLETGFFPVTRATVLRMTGGRGGAKPVAAARNDPLSSGAAAGEESGGQASSAAEAAGMKAFLQQAGVNFETVSGSNLAYDGSALIVTQSARNLVRIRNILDRYNDVRQVEIEAKFMEVQEGALEELGVRWAVSTTGSRSSATYATSNRPLFGAFNNTVSGQQGRIIRPALFNDANGNGVQDPDEATTQAPIDFPIVNNAPVPPGAADLGQNAGPLATISGIIGEFDVNAVVRALSQKEGTDLLSAPKVTVLSGNPATITVAQEMRYPQSYGQTQAQVGTGSASGGGSAGVAITAGTPQEFTMRNVGVELKVTPTVEEDDYSISLDLNPRVTEFDGFVEYGGPSIAISGSTTVNVPSGFYQPIFSVRDISTKVTIWDGATLVMGGLTREEVRKVNDKVPILGDLPLIGRAFRSKGESAQKRNLLIFVTANLVSPGGSPKKQRLQSGPGNTLFQNPTIVTPAGAEPRPHVAETR